jgi:hypothetical protein
MMINNAINYLPSSNFIIIIIININYLLINNKNKITNEHWIHSSSYSIDDDLDVMILFKKY